jgi:hypothetical protein
MSPNLVKLGADLIHGGFREHPGVAGAADGPDPPHADYVLDAVDGPPDLLGNDPDGK